MLHLDSCLLTSAGNVQIQPDGPAPASRTNQTLHFPMVIQNVNLSAKFRALVPYSITLETFLLQQKFIRYVVRNGAGRGEMSFITVHPPVVSYGICSSFDLQLVYKMAITQFVTRNIQQTGQYVRTFLPEACHLEVGLHLEASEFKWFLLLIPSQCYIFSFSP